MTETQDRPVTLESGLQRRTAKEQMIPVIRPCSCYGCKNSAVARGLCDMHRKRQERHGHVEQTRRNDWGRRSNHPLYKTWTGLRRSQGSDLGSWYDDFWDFVKHVGAK